MKLHAFLTTVIVAVVASTDGARAATIAQYNLGEDDGAFAIAGFPGVDPTLNAVGSNHLKKIGDQTYSADTPGGGSTLSISYDGSGDYYYGAAPTTDVTQDFSYSFDAKMNARGAGGFPFLASLGSNFGGISVVEIGGNVSVFFPGAGNGTGTFAPTTGVNAVWHHYQVDYSYNGGGGAQVATLTVDGNLVSTKTGVLAGGGDGQIINALTLGGNFRLNAAALDAVRTASDFEGSFNGLIDNFRFEAEAVPEPSAMILLGMGSAAGVMVYRRKSC